MGANRSAKVSFWRWFTALPDSWQEQILMMLDDDDPIIFSGDLVDENGKVAFRMLLGPSKLIDHLVAGFTSEHPN